MQVRAGKTNKNGTKSMILEALAQLPQREQIEIHRRLGRWLKNKPNKDRAPKTLHSFDLPFLQTALGQYIANEADASIDISKVRRTLAKAETSWSQEIIVEREER